MTVRWARRLAAICTGLALLVLTVAATDDCGCECCEYVPSCTEDEVIVREPYPEGSLRCIHIDELR